MNWKNEFTQEVISEQSYNNLDWYNKKNYIPTTNSITKRKTDDENVVFAVGADNIIEAIVNAADLAAEPETDNSNSDPSPDFGGFSDGDTGGAGASSDF